MGIILAEHTMIIWQIDVLHSRRFYLCNTGAIDKKATAMLLVSMRSTEALWCFELNPVTPHTENADMVTLYKCYHFRWSLTTWSDDIIDIMVSHMLSDDSNNLFIYFSEKCSAFIFVSSVLQPCLRGQCKKSAYIG